MVRVMTEEFRRGGIVRRPEKPEEGPGVFFALSRGVVITDGKAARETIDKINKIAADNGLSPPEIRTTIGEEDRDRISKALEELEGKRPWQSPESENETSS